LCLPLLTLISLSFLLCSNNLLASSSTFLFPSWSDLALYLPKYLLIFQNLTLGVKSPSHICILIENSLESENNSAYKEWILMWHFRHNTKWWGNCFWKGTLVYAWKKHTTLGNVQASTGDEVKSLVHFNAHLSSWMLAAL
jgi:hypothetical protein